MPETLQLFATCPRGIEDLLQQELQQLGAGNIESVTAGAGFSGDLKTAYRVCLWSRLASRVLLYLAEFEAANEDQLYRGVSAIDWSQHLGENGTLAVSCHLSDSNLNNSHYAALKTKDAIVDQFNERFGRRPSVDRERPDVRVNVYIRDNRARLALDLSGDSLHKRGYRNVHVKAPMKENLAAAILLRCGWPGQARALVDLMCGSGTLLLEATLMALKIAPAVQRDYFGFIHWKGHDQEAWNDLRREAEALKQEAMQTSGLIVRGYDHDEGAVNAARKNVRQAGLQKFIHVEKRSLQQCAVAGADHPGLVVVNPPYGARLGEVRELAYLYADLGDCWKRHFGGWRAALFTGNLELAKQVGLRAHKTNTLYNGAIKCKLFQYDIRPLKQVDNAALQEKEQQARAIIANRLKKNFKHLSRWAHKNAVECFRVYDADIPEYAAAIDIYGDHVLVQEYQAPASIDIRKARQRLRQIMEVIPECLRVANENIILKTRSQQKGLSQYEKLAGSGNEIVVHEGDMKFLVNLRDYLDTGLFLDHRPTRETVRKLAKGGHFLNLFAYTGSVSVYAAAGGAASTTTVDMSNTYLDWARRNFELNGLSDSRHRFIKADCLQWLKQQEKLSRRYDLIFLDPPTFSNSKSMEAAFDVQKDHAFLIRTAMKLLTAEGLLLFSNNFRKFKMDETIEQEFDVCDITQATIPEDFRRNSRIHGCWEIRFKR